MGATLAGEPVCFRCRYRTRKVQSFVILMKEFCYEVELQSQWQKSFLAAI